MNKTKLTPAEKAAAKKYLSAKKARDKAVAEHAALIAKYSKTFPHLFAQPK